MARLHGGTLGKWVSYMGERLPPCKQPVAFTWGNGWLGLGGKYEVSAGKPMFSLELAAFWGSKSAAKPSVPS